MNSTELITWIRRQLGDPIIDVELENSQIQSCIDESLVKWGKRNPIMKIDTVAVVSGTQEYTLTNYGTGLLRVVPEPTSDFESSDFDVFRDRVYFYPHYTLGDLVLIDTYIEALNSITGTEFDWYFDEPNAKLYISPSPNSSYNLMYVYCEIPTVDQATAKYEWVQNYALAKAKGILGLIRRKHGDQIPGSELNIQLDGSTLVSESKEEIRDLEEQFRNINPSRTPPLVG